MIDIHRSYQNLLFWACIVWHRLSANQIVRCFKLKKLKNYMRYQVDFLLPLKLEKLSEYFSLCRKILLASQFAGFFYDQWKEVLKQLILIKGLTNIFWLPISRFCSFTCDRFVHWDHFKENFFQIPFHACSCNKFTLADVLKNYSRFSQSLFKFCIWIFSSIDIPYF